MTFCAMRLPPWLMKDPMPESELIAHENGDHVAGSEGRIKRGAAGGSIAIDNRAFELNPMVDANQASPPPTLAEFCAIVQFWKMTRLVSKANPPPVPVQVLPEIVELRNTGVKPLSQKSRNPPPSPTTSGSSLSVWLPEKVEPLTDMFRTPPYRPPPESLASLFLMVDD